MHTTLTILILIVLNIVGTGARLTRVKNTVHHLRYHFDVEFSLLISTLLKQAGRIKKNDKPTNQKIIQIS